MNTTRLTFKELVSLVDQEHRWGNCPWGQEFYFKITQHRRDIALDLLQSKLDPYHKGTKEECAGALAYVALVW